MRDYLPSPSHGVWHVGPVPIRAYALCLIVGIFVALFVTRRRWVTRGRNADDVYTIATWAVPFGIVGGRLYHVITDPELYFEKDRHPIEALYIWRGGLGIWGAVALGAVGAWIGCRRRGVPLADFADALAPGLVLAQAIGRWGNYFNQELYGRPSGLPWALRIDPANRPPNTPTIALYQPTFLYESLWDVGVALLLVWADRRFTLRRGRLFALYVLAYTAGRGWVESLRVDHANHLAGLRLNDWTSILVFLAAGAYLFTTRPGGAERRQRREFNRPPSAEQWESMFGTLEPDVVVIPAPAPTEASPPTGPGGAILVLESNEARESKDSSLFRPPHDRPERDSGAG